MRRRRTRAVKPGKEPDWPIATSNGEVEGPPRSADQAPRAHTVFQRPRRVTTDRSRSPPTIVRRPSLSSGALGRAHVPKLNEGLSEEQGNRPAKPSSELQFFRGLYSLWAMTPESMQYIHKYAKE